MRSVQQDNGGDSKLLKNIAQEKVHQSFSKWPLGVHRKCVECKSVPNRRHWWGGVVNLFKKTYDSSLPVRTSNSMHRFEIFFFHYFHDGIH